MLLLLRLSISTVNNRSVVLWFLMQFIHRWVEYSGMLEANSSLTSWFWVALIYSKIRRALYTGRWFMLNLYLWLWRTELASFKILTVLVQRQWLKDLNFGYSGTPLLLILCTTLRAFPEMIQDHFLCKAVSSFHCQWIITHRVHYYTNIISNN